MQKMVFPLSLVIAGSLFSIEAERTLAQKPVDFYTEFATVIVIL